MVAYTGEHGPRDQAGKGNPNSAATALSATTLSPRVRSTVTNAFLALCGGSLCACAGGRAGRDGLWARRVRVCQVRILVRREEFQEL